VQAQRECRNIYFTPLVHSMYALHLRRWLRIFPREPCSMVKRALLAEAELAQRERRPRARAWGTLGLQSRATAVQGLQGRFGPPPRQHESSGSIAEFGRPPRSFLLLRFDDLVLQPLLALQQLAAFLGVSPPPSNFKVEVGPLAIVSITIATVSTATASIAKVSVAKVSVAITSTTCTCLQRRRRHTEPLAIQVGRANYTTNERLLRTGALKPQTLAMLQSYFKPHNDALHAMFPHSKFW
jgi:hypothetical protein